MNPRIFQQIVAFIRDLYHTDERIGLHEPCFIGNEKKYVLDTIDTTFVSSVGNFVNQFERSIATYCGSRYAVAVVNGTEALYLALKLVGVGQGDEVLTQPLTFVATANAITYTGAEPVFLDVDEDTLGLSPESLIDFINETCEIRDNGCFNKVTKKRIAACVPMHTYGHPCRIDQLKDICHKSNIFLIEDAAESLGSTYAGRATGTFGEIGIFSFNGNKIVTTGGGGMILTDNEEFARRAKHLTTQAKVSHPWNFFHDETGFNLRLPNINAALGVAQMEQLDMFLGKKRELASAYSDFFDRINVKFVKEPVNTRSNYWLNTILFNDQRVRNSFLEFSNKNGIMTRPAWELMTTLPMFRNSLVWNINNAIGLSNRIVNLPSSVII